MTPSYLSRVKITRKRGRIHEVVATAEDGTQMSLPCTNLTLVWHPRGLEQVTFSLGGHRVDIEDAA